MSIIRGESGRSHLCKGMWYKDSTSFAESIPSKLGHVPQVNIEGIFDPYLLVNTTELVVF
jgi:hypothetical protein